VSRSTFSRSVLGMIWFAVSVDFRQILSRSGFIQVSFSEPSQCKSSGRNEHLRDTYEPGTGVEQSIRTREAANPSGDGKGLVGPEGRPGGLDEQRGGGT
jgi:hypothetical protein